MHHKFCLIDDAVLFNGSYNWTYYAELRNEENTVLIKNCEAVASDFRNEFNLLKNKIGQSVQKIVPFEQADLQRFERMGFREYISKDIELKVSYVKAHKQNADVQKLAKLIEKAVEFDGQNREAKRLQNSLLPQVTLDRNITQVQQTVQQVMAPVASTHKVSKPNFELPAENLPSNITSSEATQSSLPNNSQPVINVTPATSANETVAPVKTTLPMPSHSTAPLVTRPSSQTTAKPRAGVVSTQAPSVATPSAVVVDTKFSIPESQVKAAMFKNLQLVFALDYSGSMGGNGGYNLYASGKVQKVIDMIFAIGQGLTARGEIDVFLFDDKLIRLPAITAKNYRDYVQQVVLKYKMGGTKLFTPIKGIYI